MEAREQPMPKRNVARRCPRVGSERLVQTALNPALVLYTLSVFGSSAHLEDDGVHGAVRHAELAQPEGGAQVGGEEAGAQHHRLLSIQVSAEGTA